MTTLEKSALQFLERLNLNTITPPNDDIALRLQSIERKLSLVEFTIDKLLFLLKRNRL